MNKGSFQALMPKDLEVSIAEMGVDSSCHFEETCSVGDLQCTNEGGTLQ